MTGPLAEALDVLAARLVGRPPGPAPAGSPESAERRQLLLGAALLTGRGDLAQDAVHVASARLHLHPAAEPDGRLTHHEVLRAVRELNAADG